MQKFLSGILIIVFSLFITHVTAQNQPGGHHHGLDSLKQIKDCQPKDLIELIWKKPLLNQNEEKWFNIIVIPFLGYTPATDLQIGAGASCSLKTSLGTKTKLSAGSLQAYYTLEHQLVTQLKTNIFTYRNLWFLQGDLRLYLFQQPTNGLGTSNKNFTPLPTDPPETRTDIYLHGSYPMKYNWFKFHEIFSTKITSSFYAGLGYHLDYHFDINDEALHTDSGILYTTPHYSYCRKYGFNNETYLSSGISANFVFDTRDNIINPYKGFYVNVNYRTNFTWLGSDQNGSLIWTEFRTYVGFSKRLPRHLIAFWTYGSFQISGKIPYLDLMSNAFDQGNSSGRGYEQGRWRGQDFVYGEVEYRFPISQCSQVLGGVVFVNLTSASSRDQQVPLFGYLKPAGGIGLRVMVNKEDRTNISIDYAIGDGSKGFYFQIAEIF
jgi:hypothetical protein